MKSKSQNPSENNKNDFTEIEKARIHIVVDLINYVPGSVVSKTFIRKSSGNITISSLDAGEELPVKTSPYDNYIQIIDGVAEIEINKKKYQLRLGEGIIIPAHASQYFNATEQFKMLCTVFKSGYED